MHLVIFPLLVSAWFNFISQFSSCCSPVIHNGTWCCDGFSLHSILMRISTHPSIHPFSAESWGVGGRVESNLAVIGHQSIRDKQPHDLTVRPMCACHFPTWWIKRSTHDIRHSSLLKPPSLPFRFYPYCLERVKTVTGWCTLQTPGTLWPSRW